ncbi:MAG: lipocalin family protein [Deltaproteobacteria bacterium]|nr:lipocalin family protein [Deltaproteobacteria bacterium]
MRKIILLVLIGLGGCLGVPEGVLPIDGFEINRYLGTWYEIARLDHPFERGLEKVSANYSLMDNGGIKVVNRGYDPKKGKWNEAVGKAYFVDEPDVGKLKVSFFGPFYGSYNIIELDKKDYQYALVCGPDRSYLWILARDVNIADEIIQRLATKANSLGFDTDQLIFVEH